MNPAVNPVILPFLLFASTVAIAAQSNQTDPSSRNITVSFRPSVSIAIFVFTIMFTATFLLLVYAKFCHTAAADLFRPGRRLPDHLLPPLQRSSGIDKSVIESLPSFRFSSLRGSREGLECAVCLSAFEDAEILRLLPKCKHAFHVGCVDRWLAGHSSCPLCRSKVTAEDAVAGGGDIELFVEREATVRRGSSRLSIGKVEEGTEEREDALLAAEGGYGGRILHKFRHRIVASGVVFRSRWSDVSSSDLTSMNAEMINMVSSKRFTGFEVGEERREYVSIPSSSGGGGGSRSLIGQRERCMSEITSLSRFRVLRETSGSNGKDERVRRVWLPIARGTVQWLAGREKRTQSTQYTGESTDV